jgi:TPP-dependent indolepyruvate ferredoxin oxidoreductase alpha subunit
MPQALEGSQAIAQAVALCRPQVVAAYPITPQTHIVENISKLVADGKLACEFVSVESEFSAASVALGAGPGRLPGLHRLRLPGHPAHGRGALQHRRRCACRWS